MAKRCFLCDVRDGRATATPFYLASGSTDLMAIENPSPDEDRVVSVIVASKEHLVPFQQQPVSILIWTQILQALRDQMPRLKAQHSEHVVGTTLELQEEEHVSIEMYVRRKK
jgi:hypothetical protein